MDDDGQAANDARVLALFSSANPVETPTPGARAWLARDTADGQLPVLIKRIDAAAAGKGRATGALALRHPHVVRTRRWLAQDTSALYVVRDVVKGKNLRQLLGTGASGQSAEATQRLLLPVVEALEYAHMQGFAHGGVSPENVLIDEGGNVCVCDWATVDPKSSRHFLHYHGTASANGDVQALGAIVIELLPTTGAFASAAVRERIAGIVNRCDTLADLKEAVHALDRLAAAPLPRATAPSQPAATPPPPPADDANAPRLSCTLAQKSARVLTGGGGVATLVIRNEGNGPLTIRMIATQHAWLNVRPIELPLVIAPGGHQSLGFVISAARLTPGDYRSEVHFSANAPGKTAEDLRGGWFKHSAEIRVTVDANPTLTSKENASPVATRRQPAKPPFPADAPRLRTGPGCLLALPAVLLASLQGRTETSRCCASRSLRRLQEH